MFHHWIALILFALFALSGIGLSVFGIGGTFLIFIGALVYDLISWTMVIPTTTLLWLLGLAILGELLEWIVMATGAKASGTSLYGVIGSLVGAIFGAVFLSVIPVIGTVVGLVLGALLGAYLLELVRTGKSTKAWKAAKAAFVGRALVSLCKTAIALLQIWLVVKASGF